MRRSNSIGTSGPTHTEPLHIGIGLLIGLVLSAAALVPSPPSGATTGDITNWPDQDGDATADIDGPTSLVVGPDGNVWYTNHDNNTIGEVDPATGNMLVFDGAGINGPTDITVGFGNQLWYPNQNGNTLGRISTDNGDRSECADPQGLVNHPESIVRGAYPYLYFTNRGSSSIGRAQVGEPCSAASTIEVLTDPQGEVLTPTDIIVGPDNAIWFTNQENGRLGRLDPNSWGPTGITTFAIPGASGLFGITVGPDGNIWMTDRDLGTAIRFVVATSTSTTFPLGLNSPEGLTTGPDGRLWVAGYHSSNVARISTDGIVQRFAGSAINRPTELVSGPGGELWGTSFLGDALFSLDPGPRFGDVNFVHPFYDEIDWMAGEGITTGYDGSIYKPAASVTRASMSAFMYRLAGEPASPTPDHPTFRDVPISHPFYGEIEWMAAEGITTGYDGGVFKPADVVRRASMAAFMYRLAGEPPASPSNQFSDVPATSTFATEIGWLVQEEITTGYPGGVFKPNNVVTRASMSAFMYRLAPFVQA